MKKILSFLLLCVAQLNASAFILQDGVSTPLYKPSIKAGVLDKTFGSGTGKVTTAIGSGSDVANALAVQADGKIVVGGYSNNGSNNDFALVRYTTSGDLDTTFGSGTGKVTTAIGSSHDVANTLAIQADGKIVVGGYSYNGSNNDFALVRYTTSGDLDTTFGSGTGKVTTAIGSSDDIANTLAIQADGKIVVGGYSHNGSNSDFALVRYTTFGDLDTTFGSGTGKVTTAIGSSGDIINVIAIQSDDKIVAGGYSNNGSNYDFALARYTTDIDPLTQSASLFVNGRGGLVR